MSTARPRRQSSKLAKELRDRLRWFQVTEYRLGRLPLRGIAYSRPPNLQACWPARSITWAHVMKRHPQVIAFMTPFPYSVEIDAPLAEAHGLMRKHGFRHLPVMLAGAIAGILTDRDIKLILGAEFGSPDERELKVRDAFVEQPCIVAASAPVGKVAKMMAERHIGSAIVTKNDKLVGIFTVTDACRALAQVLGENEAESERVA
jgi:acetoin utilization protein AcuB